MFIFGLILLADIRKRTNRKVIKRGNVKIGRVKTTIKAVPGPNINSINADSGKIKSRKGKVSDLAKPGKGTRKKKLRRKPTDNDIIMSQQEAAGQMNEADGDFSESSFMIAAEERTTAKKDEGLEVDIPVEPAPEKNGSDDINSNGEIDTKTKPAFGESLNVGFTGRNSRNNVKRRRSRITKLEHTDDTAGGAADEASADEPITMEEVKSTKPLISDVDEESYIEWDSSDKSAESSTVVEENFVINGELKCRNCDDIIYMKYIKFYVRRFDNEETRVNGPFCSKLCSMEFSES